MKKPLLLTIPVLWLNSVLMLTSCPSKRNLHPTCSYPQRATLTAWNNTDSIPRPADGAGVRAKAFYLELHLVDTYYQCSRPTPVWPINAAYAQSTTGKALNVEVDSIAITSNNSFDAAHPAGANLFPLFEKGNTKYVKEIYYLQHPPADTGTHTFTMHLYMTDSARNLSIIAPPVKLLL